VSRKSAASERRFSSRLLASIDETTYLRIRSGAVHRFIAVWVVVVKGRVFVRSWNDKPGGWYRAFLEEPRGAIQVDGRAVTVRARQARGERLMETMEDAYAVKYTTPASRFYVRGFKTARRRKATLELLPTAIH
jgi:hypothetical protein